MYLKKKKKKYIFYNFINPTMTENTPYLLINDYNLQLIKLKLFLLLNQKYFNNISKIHI